MIHYDAVDGGELPGILVYVRACLTGDEPTDVQEYAAKNPAFPAQSTLDQFFGETQFESYRALGYHSATQVFKDVLKELGLLFPERTVHDPAEAFIQENRALFSELRRRWFPPIPDSDARSSKHRKTGWRSNSSSATPRPSRYSSASSFPSWDRLERRPALSAAAANGREGAEDCADATRGGQHDREVAEVTAVGQILQVMENAWLCAADGESP